MKSIVQSEKECYLCRKRFGAQKVSHLECHHLFGGGNRNLSEKYGLKVYLCHYHHNEPPEGAHFNWKTMVELRKDGQRAFEKHFPNEDFLKIFGRNYL